MRAHLIVNGVVTNTIEVGSLDFMPGLVEATVGSIGWLYDGNTFTPPTPVMMTAAEARTIRDGLLVASDWTQVLDATVNQVAWAAYRTLLRDIPEQAGFPADIDWPISP
jgi:hypothetical protein